jgi:cell division protease FtsH
VEILEANREDMDKVVAYLMEKETITGGEMVAIIEGRDPALVENPYASTKPRDTAIEAPAKKVHMISEKIEAPAEAEAPATPEPSAETENTSKPEETAE